MYSRTGAIGPEFQNGPRRTALAGVAVPDSNVSRRGPDAGSGRPAVPVALGVAGVVLPFGAAAFAAGSWGSSVVRDAVRATPCVVVMSAPQTRSSPTRPRGCAASYEFVKRRPDGRLTTAIIVARSPVGPDPHNASAAVDRYGYLHAVWGMRNSPWRYKVSTRPRDITSWDDGGPLAEGTARSARGIPGIEISYPSFVKDADGDRFVALRHRVDSGGRDSRGARPTGGSRRGNERVVRDTPERRIWAPRRGRERVSARVDGERAGREARDRKSVV
jgi:hypothetical protein